MQTKSTPKKTKIKLNIKWTGIYDVDELFRASAAPLKTLDDLSTSLHKKSKRFKKSTYTHIVLNWTLTDSLYAMLYIFSTTQENIVNHIEFRIVSHSPYLALNKNKLPQGVLQIYEDFEALVDVLDAIPDQLSELKPQIQHLAEEAKEFPDRCKDIVKNSNMGVADSLKANKRIMKNVQKISNAKLVLEEVQESAKSMSHAIQEFCKTWEGSYQRVEAVGKKAREAGDLHPKSVVSYHWPEQNRVDMKLDAPKKPKPQKK